MAAIKTVPEIKSKIGDFKFVLEQYRNRQKILNGATEITIELSAISLHIVNLNNIIYDLEQLTKDNETVIRKNWLDAHKKNKEKMYACRELGFRLQEAFCKEAEEKYLDTLWFILSDY